MRDFSWNYFCATGDVDAYMLYKEIMVGDDADESQDEPLLTEEAVDGG